MGKKLVGLRKYIKIGQSIYNLFPVKIRLNTPVWLAKIKLIFYTLVPWSIERDKEPLTGLELIGLVPIYLVRVGKEIMDWKCVFRK